MKQNLTQFTNAFRINVAQIAEEIGLIESTSPRQKELGTIEFVDPVTSTDGFVLKYQLNESGWVRRREEYLSRSGYNARSMANLLNERITTKSGKTYRVRAERNEQLGLFIKGVVKYRQYLKED